MRSLGLRSRRADSVLKEAYVDLADHPDHCCRRAFVGGLRLQPTLVSKPGGRGQLCVTGMQRFPAHYRPDRRRTASRPPVIVCH